MSLIGLLEGMQIAFFAVTKMTKDKQGDSKCAKMTCEVLFRDGDFAVLRDAYTGSVAVASRTEVTNTPPLTLV